MTLSGYLFVLSLLVNLGLLFVIVRLMEGRR